MAHHILGAVAALGVTTAIVATSLHKDEPPVPGAISLADLRKKVVEMSHFFSPSDPLFRTIFLQDMNRYFLARHRSTTSHQGWVSKLFFGENDQNPDSLKEELFHNYNFDQPGYASMRERFAGLMANIDFIACSAATDPLAQKLAEKVANDPRGTDFSWQLKEFARENNLEPGLKFSPRPDIIYRLEFPHSYHVHNYDTYGIKPQVVQMPVATPIPMERKYTSNDSVQKNPERRKSLNIATSESRERDARDFRQQERQRRRDFYTNLIPR